jgi:CheY-like chemotaxis protein
MNDVILMVEDNADDAQLLDRQLQRSALKHKLNIVPDGREAIDYLSRANQHQGLNSFHSPCLLIIDLKVPGVDGFALIEWVRKTPQTKQIPIIVYSGSASPEDIQRAYALGANAYFAKLTGPGHYNLLFATIQEFCN